AARLGPNDVVVVLFPDSGRGYMSKIFNDEWMIQQGFIADNKRATTVGDVLRSKQPSPPLITIDANASVREAMKLLEDYEISQLPVLSGDQVIGSINDVAVMQQVFANADLVQMPVSQVMGRPFPTLDESAEIDRAYKLLALANSAVVITSGERPIGVVARHDIIAFLGGR
ncbi:MAG: CBS domain-containing protein, partial [Microbacteriaceae bacterium]